MAVQRSKSDVGGKPLDDIDLKPSSGLSKSWLDKHFGVDLDRMGVEAVYKMGWSDKEISTLESHISKWNEVLGTSFKLMPFKPGEVKLDGEELESTCSEDGVLYLNRTSVNYLFCPDAFVPHEIGHNIELVVGGFDTSSAMRDFRNTLKNPGLLNADKFKTIIPPSSIPSEHEEAVKDLVSDWGEDVGYNFRQINCDAISFKNIHRTDVSLENLVSQYLSYVEIERASIEKQVVEGLSLIPNHIPHLARLAGGAWAASLFAKDILKDKELEKRALKLAGNWTDRKKGEAYEPDPNDSVEKLIMDKFGDNHLLAYAVLADSYKDHFISCANYPLLFRKSRMDRHLERLDPVKTPDPETRKNEYWLINHENDVRFLPFMLTKGSTDPDKDVITAKDICVFQLGRESGYRNPDMPKAFIETMHFLDHPNYVYRHNALWLYDGLMNLGVSSPLLGSLDSYSDEVFGSLEILEGRPGRSKENKTKLSEVYGNLTLPYFDRVLEKTKDPHPQVRSMAYTALDTTVKNSVGRQKLGVVFNRLIKCLDDESVEGWRIFSIFESMFDGFILDDETKSFLPTILEKGLSNPSSAAFAINVWSNAMESNPRDVFLEGFIPDVRQALKIVPLNRDDGKTFGRKNDAFQHLGFAIKKDPSNPAFLAFVPDLFEVSGDFSLHYEKTRILCKLYEENPSNDVLLDSIPRFFEDPEWHNAQNVWYSAFEANPFDGRVAACVDKQFGVDESRDVEECRGLGLIPKVLKLNPDLLPNKGMDYVEQSFDYTKFDQAAGVKAWFAAAVLFPDDPNVKRLGSRVIRLYSETNDDVRETIMQESLNALETCPDNPLLKPFIGLSKDFLGQSGNPLKDRALAFNKDGKLGDWVVEDSVSAIALLGDWDLGEGVKYALKSEFEKRPGDKELLSLLSPLSKNLESEDWRVVQGSLDVFEAAAKANPQASEVFEFLPALSNVYERVTYEDPPKTNQLIALKIWHAIANANPDHPRIQETRQVSEKAKKLLWT